MKLYRRVMRFIMPSHEQDRMVLRAQMQYTQAQAENWAHDAKKHMHTVHETLTGLPEPQKVTPLRLLK